MKKVLIGVPCYSAKKYCWNAFLNNLAKIEGDFDILFVDNSQIFEDLKVPVKYLKGINVAYKYSSPNPSPKRALADSQNVIRQHAIDNNYTHVLFLEQDIFPEPSMLQDLLIHDVAVVGFPYFKNLSENKTDILVWSDVSTMLDGKKEAEIVPIDFVFRKINGKLQNVFSVGLGCVLIDVNVFKNYPIEFRVDESIPPYSDTFFAQDLYMNKISFFADTSKTVKHLDNPELYNKLNNPKSNQMKEVKKTPANVKMNPADSQTKTNEQILIENAKNEIHDLRFHAETLGMEIQDIFKLNPNPAEMKNIRVRKRLFNSIQELRNVNHSISAKEHVLNQYIERGNG
jgi:hypothetical protein